MAERTSAVGHNAGDSNGRVTSRPLPAVIPDTGTVAPRPDRGQLPTRLRPGRVRFGRVRFGGVLLGPFSSSGVMGTGTALIQLDNGALRLTRGRATKRSPPSRGIGSAR
ncbi:hypothetical protein [Streptomyces sp. NPDC015125]|uniref:hypothetical protein n=1 Tax=Streptomyces sp. NPDC015125 TaxID=3364938 RepID=UPI0037006946